MKKHEWRPLSKKKAYIALGSLVRNGRSYNVFLTVSPRSIATAVRRGWRSVSVGLLVERQPESKESAE